MLANEFSALCATKEDDENEINNNSIQNLNLQTKQKLQTMIENYRPNKTSKSPIEMKLILKDEIPVTLRPRRIPIADQTLVEQQVQCWLDEDIVRPSNSQYTAPIVLVSKKDGTKRLCIDYRKLNEKIIKDNFPMPLIDDVLFKLQKATIYTTLDFKNAFFHVPINTDSQKFTSFVTHHGQFEFTKVPFGLSNSPAVFCRFIHAIFQDLMHKNIIIIYMDDLMIPACSIEESLKKLEIIFERAQEYGLQINWQKCQFLKNEVTFLGYIIKNSTIAPSLTKTKAIETFPIPKDIKELQRFLGLTSYFRRFIKNYTIIAKPLTDLLAKNTIFNLNDEQHIAIQELKTALTNAPVLHIFNQNANTEIHTDASMFGYGATLLQKNSEDQLWHPIEYMSRKTTAVEQKYSSYELEVLAVVQALKKWRCYVLGIHIKIVTDCIAFTQTVKKSDIPLRIQRWVIYLQDFDYEIEHRPASKLRHVDALSRVYCRMLESSLKLRIIEAQDRDDWTKTIKELLKTQQHKNFFMKYNILYNDPIKEQIVIPCTMEKEIIEIAHCQGHFSIKKTEDIVQQNFFIPKLHEKVSQIVRNCVKCIIADSKYGKKDGFLNPIDKLDRPLDTFHIDHVGPMVKTQKQYSYILTIIDSFSKFVWIYPTKSTGTNEVISTLEKIATTFGNPNRIISDKGTAFTSHAFKEYCSCHNIKHIEVTTGVPRANGQVERIHRIVISMLTKLTINDPPNWYKHLPKIQQTLNNTITRSTNNTPFNILTGFKMKVNDLDEIKNILTQEEINFLNDEREKIRTTAKENILKIQEENRHTYNKNRKQENEYQIGEIVAIKRTQFGSDLKIKGKFLGPYKIIDKKRNGRYRVEKLGEVEGPRITSTIAEYMKPYPT